ncbi:MAG: hypothetical protein JST84_05625 [Acidobacteria bacterium]|nr:hypothetical protein [Acidobacteriota bacterium]
MTTISFDATGKLNPERQRVLRDVEIIGNTRTGVETESSIFGEPKNVTCREVVQALTIYGLVREGKASLAAADPMFAFGQTGRTAKK